MEICDFLTFLTCYMSVFGLLKIIKYLIQFLDQMNGDDD